MEGAERPELRLGLVLYGGVSLAVYIYGVVVEVQRLLRASAAHGGREGADGKKASKAYRDAMKRAGLSRVTVDIVSGTSAGGINGILLAKALAAGADVEEVRDLWLEGGEIDGLMRRIGTKKPKSLMDTGIFEGKLRKGFTDLDAAAGSTPIAPPPAFDLFVSATHLRGERRSFLDALEGPLETLVHRKVFRRRLRSSYDPEDFSANEPLVKLARATSAFPVAFQPVEIVEPDGLLGPFDEPKGWFADGGILNNKPFTEALGAIFTRSSDRPVRRWLLSVDPDPKASTEVRPGDEPAVDQVALKAVAGIPRYQSIAGDLEALEDHNERVRRLTRTVLDVESGLDGGGPTGPGDGGGGPAYDSLRGRVWGREIGEQLFSALWPGDQRDQLDREVVAARMVELALSELRGAAIADLALEKRRAYYLIKLIAIAAGVEGDPVQLREALWEGFEAASEAIWKGFGEPFGPGAKGPARVPVDQIFDFARERVVGARDSCETTRATIRSGVRTALEGAAVALPTPGGSGATFEVSLLDAFDAFEPRDALLLPIELSCGLRGRDTINHAQISTKTAGGTGVEPDEKLAGDAVGHFGGFLKKTWRENDLMWGRLDGAEIIVKAMLVGRSEAELRDAIAAVQKEIFDEERPNADLPDGDWRAYLKQNALGKAKLDNLRLWRRIGLGARAGTVLRRMLHTARRQAKAESKKGLRSKVLGHVDRFVRFSGAILFPLRLLAYPIVRPLVWWTERKANED